jgi:hypothetical protein
MLTPPIKKGVPVKKPLHPTNQKGVPVKKPLHPSNQKPTNTIKNNKQRYNN